MTTWVLLRGLARESAHWGDFPTQLAAQLGPGHEVIALDTPGNGALHREQSPSTVAGMVGSFRAQLAQRQVEGPHVLVAMSLGAMVAIDWAQREPGEIAGCVLINTSLRGFNPLWQRLQPRNWLRLLTLLWPGTSLRRREAAVLAMTSRFQHRHADMVTSWSAIAQQRPVRPSNALRQLLAAASYRPRPSPLQVPVLMLASAGDQLVCAECSRRIAQAWDLPLWIHESAGHDLPLDDAPWVLAQIGQWRHSRLCDSKSLSIA